MMEEIIEFLDIKSNCEEEFKWKIRVKLFL